MGKQIAERLGITRFSQADFAGILAYTLEQFPPSKVLCGSVVPRPPDDEGVEIYPKYVFDIPLSGVKHLLCGDASGGKSEHFLNPGEMLFSPPACWKLPVWDSPHELFCLVYSEKFLRCTYVVCSGENAHSGARPVCDHFFHTENPPPAPLWELLRVLEKLARSTDRNPEAIAEITRALFRLTLDFLEKASSPHVFAGKSESTYRKVLQYLNENFSLPVTRKTTAVHFKVNACYLSSLFRDKSGLSFREALRKIRMEHAVFLLRETDLLVDEIAIQCGYASTPFFTSTFRSIYGIPPGHFRSETPLDGGISGAYRKK